MTLKESFKEATTLKTVEKNKFYKTVVMILFYLPFLSVYIVMSLLLTLNRWFNIILKFLIDTFLKVYQETEGSKKLVYTLVSGAILLPMIFAFYLLIIGWRIVVYIVAFVYNIFHFICTFFNDEELKSNIDLLIKNNQKGDVF